jgi:hypothetical protein
MSPYEIIVLCSAIYAIIGAASAFGAALAQSHWKTVAFAFFCWPAVAYYGLRLSIERIRIALK